MELGTIPPQIEDPNFLPRAFNDNREPMLIELELMEYEDFDCPFQADTRTGNGDHDNLDFHHHLHRELVGRVAHLLTPFSRTATFTCSFPHILLY